MKKEYNGEAEDRVKTLIKLQKTIDLLHAQFKQQQEFLVSDDVNAFLHSMAENQNRLAEIESLVRFLQSLTSQEPNPSMCKKMEDAITRSLKELQQVEKQTSELANARLDGYRKNLRDVRMVKRGIKSYLSPYSSADGMYFDKKK